jgi:glycosyltransferase involved in cell wall biosynthesis
MLSPSMRIALFTDTLADVNGVSRFIQNCAEQARLAGCEFKAVTSTRLKCPDHPNIVSIPPLYATAMPKYENLELAIPVFSRLFAWAREYRPDVVHVSTPGPVGFAGRRIARRLRLPLLGVYHTDFPAYIDHLFDDSGLTWCTSKAMSLFYRRFSRIFTRSHDYADSLVALGMPRERIVRLYPGIDIDAFHVRHADRSVWDGFGLSRDSVKILYAGRVSVEKNLPALVPVWKQVSARLAALSVDAELIVIGDGPYKKAMAEALAGTRAHFLGFRYGAELSRIYASGDLFVFPSLTDTLGQVVMEAQASGLPVVVTDAGGPKEVVLEGRTGFVVPAERPAAWADAIVALAQNGAKRRDMGIAARASMENYSITKSFQHFWSVHEEAMAEGAL